eukprot:scaffold15538_cov88-Attheya_sp.AAC.2
MRDQLLPTRYNGVVFVYSMDVATSGAVMEKATSYKNWPPSLSFAGCAVMMIHTVAALALSIPMCCPLALLLYLLSLAILLGLLASIRTLS